MLASKSRILSSIDSYSERKYWSIILSFLCCIYVLLIAFPPFYDLNNCELTNWQIEHPFSRLPDHYLNASHEQKHQFRLTIPIIGALLHLNGYGLLIIQYASAFLLFHFCYRLALKITNDRVSATLSTFLSANIYAGTVGIFDVFWHFDCLAIVLLVAALNTHNHFLIGFFILASSFTDERGFVASSLVMVYKLIENKNTPLSFKDLFSAPAITIAIAWVIYLALRMYLTYYHHFFTGTKDVSLLTFRMNWNLFPLNILFTFEFAWLLIFLGLYHVKNDTIFILITLIALVAIFSVALLVMDVSRSTAYAYPLLFIGLQKCGIRYKKYALRKLLLIVTILCTIIPTQEFFGFSTYGMGPILPKIIKLFH